ncbi:response regulator transcription factor [Arachnia propionica]|uniref:response regulator transcription factor n=1 Tax=Arachnia propionica TaxID=1750 RepID=UPI0028D23E0F|nr:response regulator transcription factor [Arachnia propionica]
MTRSEETNTIRVLIADDQPLQRAGQALILESADDIHVVAEAGNGEQAISLARKHRPDVVLMDVRMPGIGGIEATGIITRDLPGTRVIVLTTFDLDEYAFGSLRSGASAFLLKSTQPEGLVDAVRIVYSGTAVVDPRLTRQLIDHYLQRIDEPATGKREQVLAVLTPRERDVFDAIARGLTNSEISSGLHLAPSTVKSYINTIFAKLGVRDRVHAVLLAHDLERGPLP